MLSAALAQTSRAEGAPISAPARLLSLAVASTASFDGVLAGMVAVGLGIEAICSYLGFSRGCLGDNLVRLGLRTPHDRPICKARAGGRHTPWSVLDTMRLIAWRVAGIHVEVIAVRLARSPGAVRGKARRLGVPAPPRKTLRRVDPASLADPTPGFGLDGSAVRSASALSTTTLGLTSQPVQPGAAASQSLVQDLASLDQPLAPAAYARSTGASKTTIRVAGQREMPLFQVIPDGVVVSPSSPVAMVGHGGPAAPATVTAQPILSVALGPKRRRPSPQPAPEHAWIAQAKHRTHNRAVVEALSLFYFGRQSYRVTAELVGMSRGALATFYYRIGLPRDRDRGKFGAHYDEAGARDALAGSGYKLFLCNATKNWFWAHNDDRGGHRYNRETRRRLGLSTEWERYQVQEITL